MTNISGGLLTTLTVTLGLLILASFWFVATPAFGETPGLVAVPNLLRMTGVPGSNVSASFIVHVSNTSKQLLVRNVFATTLQDDSGHTISSSSITTALSNSTIGIGGAVKLGLTITIPVTTLSGNYTGQLLLFAESGPVASANLRLIVTPALISYAYLSIVVTLGVIISFVYSPLGDKKDGKARISMKRLTEAKVRDTLVVLITAGILSGVALAYFLYSSTDFGAAPFRDYPSGFLQGFLVHRGLDALKDKFFPAK